MIIKSDTIIFLICEMKYMLISNDCDVIDNIVTKQKQNKKTTKTKTKTKINKKQSYLITQQDFLYIYPPTTHAQKVADLFAVVVIVINGKW